MLGANFVKSAVGIKRNICEFLQIIQVWYIKDLNKWKILADLSKTTLDYFKPFQFPSGGPFYFLILLLSVVFIVSFAFNSTHLPVSIFRYSFVCVIWTLPFLKHLFWIGTIPTFLYFFSMNYGCGFAIHHFQEFACHDVYHISELILLKNDLAKMSSF